LSVALGLLFAHAAMAALAQWLSAQQSFALDPAFTSRLELWLLPAGLLVALLAAAGPAWRALRADVTQLLQTPH